MPARRDWRRLAQLVPGIAACAALSLSSWLIERAGYRLLGRPWLEALVLAILVGAAVRSVWSPGERWRPGIAFCAKPVLELAVLLLGASLPLAALFRAGATLLIAIVALVAAGIAGSYVASRAFGLPHPMSLLIACGNSICGNSAIAAVAPVIRAEPDDVASSIAFTAVVGVAVVVLLPLSLGVFGLSEYQYGVLAGLTVYAVPQVLAATFPVSVLSGQVATMVKLARVLLLGPVVVVLSIWHPSPDRAARRLDVRALVPWFIIGFVVLAVLRSVGVIGDPLVAASREVTSVLMVLSMAALGLGVDVRVLARVGPRVALAVSTSLLLLLGLSLLLIRVTHLH